MPSFVDLHAHFLPALDDGARTLDVGLAMIRGLTDLGFDSLHATPHQRAGLFLPDAAAIDAAFQTVGAAVGTPAAGQRPSLGVAAENFWDEVFLARSQGEGAPGYPGNRAFLFEIDPQMMPPAIESVLFRFRVKGRLPVMAHPERYAAIQGDLARAEVLSRSAALLIDLGALVGAHGRAAQKVARHLVRERLAHAGASDVHRAEDVASVAGGIAWIRDTMGEAEVVRLLDENPRRILAGELP